MAEHYIPDVITGHVYGSEEDHNQLSNFDVFSPSCGPGEYLELFNALAPYPTGPLTDFGVRERPLIIEVKFSLPRGKSGTAERQVAGHCERRENHSDVFVDVDGKRVKYSMENAYIVVIHNSECIENPVKQADATLYVNGDTAIQTIEFLRRQRSETARRPNVWVQVQGNLASIELPALTVSSLRFAVKEAWPSLRFDAARLILVEHEGLDKTNMTLKVNTPENPYTIREP